ncbi:hypothetical protein AURDEDRAFT_170594 [Auricularia subglabra TFB-10046 SS5]|nr:hypothetical protein AURDEDRAFT_170594 [Auricularia subglabra TFB-10046 SS5]
MSLPEHYSSIAILWRDDSPLLPTGSGQPVAVGSPEYVVTVDRHWDVVETRSNGKTLYLLKSDITSQYLSSANGSVQGELLKTSLERREALRLTFQCVSSDEEAYKILTADGTLALTVFPSGDGPAHVMLLPVAAGNDEHQVWHLEQVIVQ